MTNKQKYERFCTQTYVQVYSKPWWMDAVCGGSENWDVWLYEKGNDVFAAMPYYKEQRGKYRYITKAPLTQTNGIIFKYPVGQSPIKRMSFEEEIINAATEFIANLNIDVYEQQYPYTFTNFVPFFWNEFSLLPRITFVVDTSQKERIHECYSHSVRQNIKKGLRYINHFGTTDSDTFYSEQEKIYIRQGLKCPFSRELWNRLFQACVENNAGEIFTAENEQNTILSLEFVARDEKAQYSLIGGSIPEYSEMQTYTALLSHVIDVAAEKALQFDFEGSMIKRINHYMRDFGGEPKQYFRIRKVFNPEIIMKEAMA